MGHSTLNTFFLRKIQRILDHLLSKNIYCPLLSGILTTGRFSPRTMFCGCGIIIKWPKWFHRGKKAKAVDENAGRSAEAPPRYANAVDKAVSVIYEIDPIEIMDERRRMRSAAPSPEPLKETDQDA
jgi:hypothetical protein